MLRFVVFALLVVLSYQTEHNRDDDTQHLGDEPPEEVQTDHYAEVHQGPGEEYHHEVVEEGEEYPDEHIEHTDTWDGWTDAERREQQQIAEDVPGGEEHHPAYQAYHDSHGHYKTWTEQDDEEHDQKHTPQESDDTHVHAAGRDEEEPSLVHGEHELYDHDHAKPEHFENVPQDAHHHTPDEEWTPGEDANPDVGEPEPELPDDPNSGVIYEEGGDWMEDAAEYAEGGWVPKDDL
eukprot:TRINITY_DN85497_c0_g1_i1.p3 TRINITY_DN85497_c0_g1~~TRINITY_DN85497_c0_g1_i1.p3  ORF type:complete len:235 (-),score=40.80 TRINITY_DN85497_c0_g1_i1:1390-2094(-)